MNKYVRNWEYLKQLLFPSIYMVEVKQQNLMAFCKKSTKISYDFFELRLIFYQKYDLYEIIQSEVLVPALC
jgi:hypothetical protein